RLDLVRRDPDAAHLDHVVGPPAVVIEAVGVAKIFVAGVEPSVDEGTPRRFRIAPVARSDRRPAAPQVTDLIDFGGASLLVADRDLVALDELARSPAPDRAGAVRDEDVQGFRRTDPVEDFDPEPRRPAFGHGGRQGLA